MPEEPKPPQQTEKAAPKVVPESDLIAVKRKAQEIEKRLREELAELKGKLAEAESELEIGATDVEDDEEVKKVKTYLKGEDNKIKQERAKLDADLAAFQERERESRVQTLASQYQVEIDAIKDAEDPEKEALRLANERLAKEKEEAETKASPESVFEHGAGGIVKKPILDMNDAEFEAKEKALKAESLSRSEIVRSRR